MSNIVVRGRSRDKKARIMARSRTGKKSKCATCHTIVAFLVQSRQPGKGETRRNLGTFDEVIHSSGCDVHTELITSFLKLSPLRGEDIESFYLTSRWPGLAQIWTKDSNGGGIGRDAYIGLMPSRTENQVYHTGQEVDSRWIQKSILRRWRRTCDSRHKAECHVPLTARRLVGKPPTWLVDTWLMCLVPGLHDMPYIGLSYVWGPAAFFKTNTSNLALLQVQQSLIDSGRRSEIPQTILDAISVTQLLGERYMWVDSLCIVQDDDEMKQSEISNMGFIFSNALVTIIARQGEDANYGLRGLRGISQPRSTSQDTFRANNHTIVKTRETGFGGCRWNKRGWTFQEALFSRRALTFYEDRVWWMCSCSTFEEDFKPQTGVIRSPFLGSGVYPKNWSRITLQSKLPDLVGYWSLASAYNGRDHTNPEDAQAGFAGVTNVFSPIFYQGFLCGMPLLYFDIVLCWQPNGECLRRVPRHDSLASRSSLPSWSWVGWRSELNQLQLSSESFFLDFRSLASKKTGQVTIPKVHWYSRAFDSVDPHPIEGPHILHSLRSKAQNPEFSTPEGWQRFENTDRRLPHFFDYEQDTVPPKYIYKHDTDPETGVWYPVPMNANPQPETTYNNDSIICGRTQKTRLYLGTSIFIEWKRGTEPGLYYRLHNNSGTWAGMMQVHERPPQIEDSSSLSSDLGMFPCDLVMISEGYTIEGADEAGMPEWDLEDRPKALKGEKYEFYNVLWVEWEDDIAYRKGCGRVMKSAWDALNPEWIDLTLG